MPGLITLLITALILLAILGVAWWALNQITLPPPVRMIAVVVLAIIAIVVLAGLLPGAHFRL